RPWAAWATAGPPPSRPSRPRSATRTPRSARPPKRPWSSSGMGGREDDGSSDRPGPGIAAELEPIPIGSRRPEASMVYWDRLLLLARPPEVPGRHRPERTPALAAAEHLAGCGQGLLAEDPGEALPHAEVIGGQHVRAAQAEDEEHLHRPPADPADGIQPADDLLIRKRADLAQGRHRPLDRPL